MSEVTNKCVECGSVKEAYYEVLGSLGSEGGLCRSCWVKARYSKYVDTAQPIWQGKALELLVRTRTVLEGVCEKYDDGDESCDVLADINELLGGG